VLGNAIDHGRNRMFVIEHRDDGARGEAG
jgi:hypothetical protein